MAPDALRKHTKKGERRELALEIFPETCPGAVILRWHQERHIVRSFKTRNVAAPGS